MDSERRVVTIDEAAEKIGCCRSIVYRHIKNGNLPARKIGRRTIIFSDDIVRFLDNLPFAGRPVSGESER